MYVNAKNEESRLPSYDEALFAISRDTVAADTSHECFPHFATNGTHLPTRYATRNIRDDHERATLDLIYPAIQSFLANFCATDKPDGTLFLLPSTTSVPEGSLPSLEDLWSPFNYTEKVPLDASDEVGGVAWDDLRGAARLSIILSNEAREKMRVNLLTAEKAEAETEMKSRVMMGAVAQQVDFRVMSELGLYKVQSVDCILFHVALSQDKL